MARRWLYFVSKSSLLIYYLSCESLPHWVDQATVQAHSNITFRQQKHVKAQNINWLSPVKKWCRHWSSSSILTESVESTALKILYDELVHDLLEANGFDKTHFHMIIIDYNSEFRSFHKKLSAWWLFPSSFSRSIYKTTSQQK